jgi:ribosome biogenesis GTPase
VTACRGTVLYGANNIFLVRPEDSSQKGLSPIECRIKGKILRGAERDYNPLAAGDAVSFLPEAKNPGRGVLLAREKRTNALLRWNKKGRAAQTIAANVDLLVCVASPVSPPFRPRFLDRLLLAAALADIPALVCLNKTDQGTRPEIEERLQDYAARGLPLVRSHVRPEEKNAGAGLRALKEAVGGKRVVFAGQSGVGKTSLLNALSGGPARKVGELSEKYNRGRHTTVLAYLETWADGEIIDTPGLREFDIYGTSSRDLRFLFPEFANFAARCRLAGCTHTHEPECAVRDAAEEGGILFDRYESYRRIYEDLVYREEKQAY